MDPTAALTEALQALDAITAEPDKRPEAAELLHALADWIERGGFPPVVSLAIDQAGVDDDKLAFFTSQDPAEQLTIVAKQLREILPHDATDTLVEKYAVLRYAMLSRQREEFLWKKIRTLEARLEKDDR